MEVFMESVTATSSRVTAGARRGSVLVGSKFAPWQTIIIGGHYAGKLQRKVSTDNLSMSGSALRAVQRVLPAAVQEPIEEVVTIRLSPSDFGQRKMSLSELIDPDRLAMWSEQNASSLPEGHAIDILPAKVGPYIWSQLANLYDLEHLLIAMRPIKVHEHKPFIYRLKQHPNEGLCLMARSAAPHIRFQLQTPFLFRLRPRKDA